MSANPLPPADYPGIDAAFQEASLKEAEKQLAEAYFLVRRLRFLMGKGPDPGKVARKDAYPLLLQEIYSEDTRLLKLLDEAPAQILQTREEVSTDEWSTRFVVLTPAGIFQAYSARAALRLAAEAQPAKL